MSPHPQGPLMSTGGSRPVLRRESAQDFGDDVEVDNPRLRLQLPKAASPQPPDLKIDLLSETSSTTTPSPLPYSAGPRPCGMGGPFFPSVSDSLDPGTDVIAHRRHSNCQRPPPISRNKSAPVTPLSRSVTNVMTAQQHLQQMARSTSKDGHLMVPERTRGSSLPEHSREKPDADLYRLRQFTTSNKRIVQRGDSLQPITRKRSSGSVHSSASR